MTTTRAVVRDGLSDAASFDVLEDGIVVGRVDVTSIVRERRYYDVFDLDGNKVHEGEVLEGWPASPDRVAVEAWRSRPT